MIGTEVAIEGGQEAEMIIGVLTEGLQAGTTTDVPIEGPWVGIDAHPGPAPETDEGQDPGIEDLPQGHLTETDKGPNHQEGVPIVRREDISGEIVVHW